MAAADCYGGYDCEFVDKPPDNCVCKICQLPSKEPQLTVCCGHTFCKSCLQRANSASHIVNSCCPICRKDTEFSYVPNKQIDRFVRGLHVYCIKKEALRCKWKGEINDIGRHLEKDCPYHDELVKCEYYDMGCTDPIPRMELESHHKKKRVYHLELLHNHIDILNQSRESMLKNNDGLCKLVKKQYSEISDNKVTINDSSKEIKRLSQQDSQHKKENNKLKNENHQLRHKASQSQEDVSTLKQELNRSTKQSQKLKDNLSQSHAEVSTLTKQNQQLKDKLSQSHAEISTLTKQSQKLKDKLSQSHAEISTLTKQSQKLKDKLSQSHAEISTLTKQNQLLKDELSQSHAEVSQLNAQIEHETKRLNGVKSKIDTPEKQNQQLKLTASQNQAEINKWKYVSGMFFGVCIGLITGYTLMKFC